MSNQVNQITILNKLGIDITAETFMDVLDNGVYICELANVIHKKAEECVQQGQCNDVSCISDGPKRTLAIM